MKNSVEPREDSTSRVRKPWTVVTVLAGSVIQSFFFFFLGTYSSAIDEASTSDIEIAPLFVLILLFSLARPLFLSLSAFLPTAVSAFFSLSAFFSFVVSAVFPFCVFPLNQLSLLDSLKVIDNLRSVTH